MNLFLRMSPSVFYLAFLLQEVKLESGSAVLVHRHGDFYVTSPACSHYGAPLRKGVSSAGGRGGAPTVTCPLHDATFDLRTGQVVRGSEGSFNVELSNPRSVERSLKILNNREIQHSRRHV